MKRLYIIRHAKSSWSDPMVSDFYRGLNKRGKKDGPFMAEKLAASGAKPDIIISSPAKRAKKTAKFMAKAVGFDLDKIIYDDDIYSSATSDLYRVLKNIDNVYEVAFFVGHNYALTDIAEELTGEQLVNIPTSGVVVMECEIESWNQIGPGLAKMISFDFPKKYQE